MQESIDFNGRNDVLQKLFTILDISENNNKISLKKLDKDLNIQKQIINLENDVQKYFDCSKWSYFINGNRKFKRKYLSLIKTIFNDMNVKIITSILIKNIDSKKTYETYYIIDNNN
jgi:hypothetical protein